MDFGDILTLLIYIAIPVFISGKRKAKKAQQEAQRERPPMQQTMQPPAKRQPPVQRQPAQGSTKAGGLMGRLESIMKEIKQSMETDEPVGGPKPATKPTEPYKQVTETYGTKGVGTASDRTLGQSREAQPGGIPVWRVAGGAEKKESLAKPGAEEKLVSKRVPVAVAEQGGHALFGKDDLVKGIILSEILQPPVTLRQRNKRRPL